jgi:hypothetical protein
MRLGVAAFLVLEVLASCGQAGPPPVRELRELDLSIFDCAPNRTHRFIPSEDALAKIFAELSSHCTPDVFEQRRHAFLRSLERAPVNFSEEVLVIAQDWYGTGMAKAGLVLTHSSDGVITATIHWNVPPPPVTPDTAFCTFAFAIKRSAVNRVTVTGQHSGSATFAPPP